MKLEMMTKAREQERVVRSGSEAKLEETTAEMDSLRKNLKEQEKNRTFAATGVDLLWENEKNPESRLKSHPLFSHYIKILKHHNRDENDILHDKVQWFPGGAEIARQLLGPMVWAFLF